MNMFRAFMELDEINEDISRQELISRFKKAAGKNYNLSDEKKFPYPKLFSMTMSAEEKVRKEQTAKKQKAIKADEQEFDFEPAPRPATCEFCNMRLNAMDQCPRCDLGEEDLLEWVTSSGQKVKMPTSTSASQTAAISPTNSSRTTTGKYKVAIVDDKGRLRAMGDDGVHGLAFVAFPNHLREFEGQHYEVEQLVWNGKNYRAVGKIEEV